MITSLHIENSESHKDTILKFTTRLNVFIGESDKGKSGVFRNYKLLTENKPGGEWMRPLFWEGTTKVTGVFEDPGCTVIRTKGKSENSYQLNDNEPVNAGTSVPEGIKKALDVDDVNLQTQIERAFLMFETAGERGRTLNRIAGLDKIESTLVNAKRDVDSLTKEWNKQNAIKKEKLEEIANFDHLELIGEKISFIDTLERTKTVTLTKSKHLAGLKRKLENVENELETKNDLSLSKSTLKVLSLKLERKEALSSKVSGLIRIRNKYDSIAAKENDENYDGAEGKLLSLQMKIKEVSRIKTRLLVLESLSTDLLLTQQQEKDLEKEIAEIQSKIPNICLECGSELK